MIDYIPGSVSPRVSTTDDMVFAVNIPPNKKIKKKREKIGIFQRVVTPDSHSNYSKTENLNKTNKKSKNRGKVFTKFFPRVSFSLVQKYFPDN